MRGDLYDLIKSQKGPMPIDFYIVPYDHFQVTVNILAAREKNAITEAAEREHGRTFDKIDWPLSKAKRSSIVSG